MQGGRIISILVGLFALAFMCCAGIAAYLFIGPGGGGMAFSEWYSRPCLVDANGDSALDIMGYAGTPGQPRPVVLIDGATGSQIWESDRTYPYDESSSICAGPQVAGFPQAGFAVEFFRADSPTPVPKVFSDEVDSYGRGDGCVSFQTRDRQTAGLLLPSLEPGDCAAPTLIGVNDVPYAINVGAAGDMTFALTERSPGTALLIVTAHRGDEQVWQKTLNITNPFTGPSEPTAMVIVDGDPIVYGAQADNDDYGVLIRLDGATGNQRYAQQQSSHWSTNWPSLAYNGRYVIMSWGFGLHAYDPATGERVWNIGGR